MTYLDVWERAELHDGAAKGSEGMFHVDREAESLTEQKLTRKNLLGMVSAKGLTEPERQDVRKAATNSLEGRRTQRC